MKLADKLLKVTLEFRQKQIDEWRTEHQRWLKEIEKTLMLCAEAGGTCEVLQFPYWEAITEYDIYMIGLYLKENGLRIYEIKDLVGRMSDGVGTGNALRVFNYKVEVFWEG